MKGKEMAVLESITGIKWGSEDFMGTGIPDQVITVRHGVL